MLHAADTAPTLPVELVDADLLFTITIAKPGRENRLRSRRSAISARTERPVN